MANKVQLDEVTVRFAGDSGDGMQLTGMQFTDTTALMGNDLSTLPDFPAEIRAPAGTLYGVSGFQLHFSSFDIHTPGDSPDVLVAMNPAALKVNLDELKPGGMIIVNSDDFDEKNLKLANYKSNPLEDGSLAGYEVHALPLSKMTLEALKDLGLPVKDAERCKNFFALGLLYWIYNRKMEPTIEWLKTKFAKKPLILEANLRALKAGYHFGETTEVFTTRYEVKPAKLKPGKYRNISGNEATALGLVAASKKSGLPLFLGSYPITPASTILHQLAGYKNYGVRTFQAEDEIAGICAAIGASFAGALGVTSTSGPGVALKTEAIGLAVMVELPLVICDIQRGGPSTGLPTKTEQADLLQALYGRNSEAPVPVLAAATPGDCFYTVYEACRIALKYMTPVFFLSDGYLANGAEPWLIPNSKDLPEIKVRFRTDPNGFYPYLRDENTLARPWAIPGTPGLEHRIGGLEKQHITGNVNYEPENHELMVKLRAEKVARIAQEIPPTRIYGQPEGDLLVVGWGSTFGSILTAVERCQAEGLLVSNVHLRYLNPLPPDLGNILKRFNKVLLPEMNLGQLAKVLRAEYLVPIISFSKVQGLPFTPGEIEKKIKELLKG
ncbi:MAG TPA: 2-oxoacid:acceptor oxidoreductase subunit alpha [Candidatus Limnocylindrales bacterium]|nr:2-oxoacid:acceptor oxidoreductase subunit alpha [Candidatus Limnocylindrales bacterium]